MRSLPANLLVNIVAPDVVAACKMLAAAVQAPLWYQLVAAVFDMEFTDILSGCYWAADSVFASHYLCDVSTEDVDCFTI